MDEKEFAYWQAITQASTYRWTEDTITQRNGAGNLYYTGGENGRYMRLSPDGKLTLGTYEGAYPHIGEALFRVAVEHQCKDINEAFQVVCRIGGLQFLQDLFSASGREAPNTEMPYEIQL